MKFGGVKIHRSFLWQHRFNTLIQERERCGFTLEKMASMLGDMALAYPDVYVSVTEEQLREVEDDPMHGMSDAAMMYVRFMGCTSHITGLPGSQMKIKDEHLDITTAKRANNKLYNKELYDALHLLQMGDIVALNSIIYAADRSGEKVDLRVNLSYLTDEEASDLATILMNAVERRMEWKRKNPNPFEEKLRLFNAVRSKRKEAKRRVREAMQEKVEPKDEEGT